MARSFEQLVGNGLHLGRPTDTDASVERNVSILSRFLAALAVTAELENIRLCIKSIS